MLRQSTHILKVAANETTTLHQTICTRRIPDNYNNNDQQVNILNVDYSFYTKVAYTICFFGTTTSYFRDLDYPLWTGDYCLHKALYKRP